MLYLCMSEQKDIIKSKKNKWTLWLTTNTDMSLSDSERWKSQHSSIISVPPTNGDRIDYIPEDYISHKGYNYNIKGWFIIIKDGEIIDILKNI